MVKALYYPVASSTGGGGGTVQTFVKIGVLKSFYAVDPEYGDGSAPVLWSTAEFDINVPLNYELFYNGQWYAKGQLNEYKLNNTTLHFPRVVWTATDVIELKYQIVV